MENNKKVKGSLKTLRRLFSYCFGMNFLLVFIFFCLILAQISRIASTVFFQIIVDNYLTPLTQNYTDELYNTFLKTIFVLVIILFSGNLITLLYKQLVAKISIVITHRIRIELFKKIQQLPITYFDTHKHGDIMSTIINDIENLKKFLINGLPNFIMESVASVCNITMMIILSWKLSLQMNIVFIGIFFVFNKVVKKSRLYFKEQQDKLGELSGYLEEMFEGQKVIKVFNREEKIITDFDSLNDSLFKSAKKANILSNLVPTILSDLSDVNFAIAVCIGLFFVIDGNITIGVALAFFQYARSFIFPIINMSNRYNETIITLVSLDRIFKILDEDSEIDKGKMLTMDKIKGHIEIKNVNFRYNDKKEILTNINIDAVCGKKIALIGATGAGKTTITSLINRFYEVSEGEILLDGTNIQDISKDILRQNIAVVLQDSNLFTGSILENVRFGRLDATDDEVIKALKMSNAYNFVEKLPDTYKTIITDNGGNLSQGEKQLLSIARAMLSKSPILLLDEATSSIDTRTEKIIEDSLNKLMKNKTTFIVAHRLSTIRNSDIILVLENGKIIEQGKHTELLEQQGKYYQLYNGLLEIS
ncbi:MAG: ABC transporter ATP-binding protein [Rickettsiales bacterium]|nr:MAG: ABC transporter ATP-binding protein [Rickettsiales bacterium]